jgi:hypothetical protein
MVPAEGHSSDVKYLHLFRLVSDTLILFSSWWSRQENRKDSDHPRGFLSTTRSVEHQNEAL